MVKNEVENEILIFGNEFECIILKNLKKKLNLNLFFLFLI